MIEKYLGQYEGKTIEFKENTEFLDSIIRTVIAFANTAGGVILIGVADAARQVVGLSDVRKEELRISNAIANSIMPLIRPDIDVVAYRNKEIILITCNLQGQKRGYTLGLDQQIVWLMMRQSTP